MYVLSLPHHCFSALGQTKQLVTLKSHCPVSIVEPFLWLHSSSVGITLSAHTLTWSATRVMETVMDISPPEEDVNISSVSASSTCGADFDLL